MKQLFRTGFAGRAVSQCAQYFVAERAAYRIDQIPQGIQQSGCSDTSFVTRIGIPALCSLGIQGAGAHSLDEYAIPSSLLVQCKKLVATILAM